jgi:hypothetical protein
MTGEHVMTRLYLKHEKTGRQYRVVRLDKEKNEIILKGEYSEFAEKYDKDRLQRLGYRLVKEEVVDG